MLSQPIDPGTRQELVRQLASAFPTRGELDQLTQFYLNTPLSAIPTEGSDNVSLALGVVTWCERHGNDTLEQLVAGAIEERPNRTELGKLLEKLHPIPSPVPPLSLQERSELYN